MLVIDSLLEGGNQSSLRHLYGADTIRYLDLYKEKQSDT